ncbi:MAG: hypothetical protein AAF081_08040 [Actinomycetota bacterium]
MAKGWKIAAAVAMVGSLFSVAPASAGGPAGPTVKVTSEADSGEGSFRAAVEAANGDRSITRIVFDKDLNIALSDDVEFTGWQSLLIDGNGSTVSGATAEAADTWDGGLFVSSGLTLKLTIRELTFADSPNNGIAVFVPEVQGRLVDVDILNVTVATAQFHGILIDAQETTGFNTDDVIHPNCVDPHPFDGNSSLDVRLKNVTVTGAGTLADDYDISVETGCPQDFDGVRVDEGGKGDLTAAILDSVFNDNLADGVELDESEVGSINANVKRSTFSGNGETVAIPFDGDTIDDLDDGFDIDEAGEGDLIARVTGSTVSGNFDEGLDFDEEDGGDVVVTVINTVADGNEDEGMKADEEGEGSLRWTMRKSSSTNSLSQDGVQLEEQQDGDLIVSIRTSTITGNDGDGLKAEELDGGNLTGNVRSSTISGNLDGVGILLDEADDGTGSAVIRNNDVSGNSDGPFDISVDSLVESGNIV